jgi:hypothetical protein
MFFTLDKVDKHINFRVIIGLLVVCFIIGFARLTLNKPLPHHRASNFRKIENN